MLKAISDNYRDVYDLLVTKQRLVNEARWKNSQQTNNEIFGLITALVPAELEELIEFLVQGIERFFRKIFIVNFTVS